MRGLGIPGFKVCSTSLSGLLGPRAQGFGGHRVPTTSAATPATEENFSLYDLDSGRGGHPLKGVGGGGGGAGSGVNP